MRKSTILALVLTYLVALIVVGFFGRALKVYNEVSYVEDIALIDPDNGQTGLIISDASVETKGEYKYSCYLPWKNGGVSTRMQVKVLPVNSTYTGVRVTNDAKDYEDKNISFNYEEPYIAITFNENNYGYLDCSFTVNSKDGDFTPYRVLVFTM